MTTATIPVLSYDDHHAIAKARELVQHRVSTDIRQQVSESFADLLYPIALWETAMAASQNGSHLDRLIDAGKALTGSPRAVRRCWWRSEWG